MLANLQFAFEVTAPTFLVICLGIYLKRIGLINNEFADIGSKLVFQVAFGDSVLKTASVYLAFLTILYNILSLTAFARHQGVRASPYKTIKSIAKNPLIVSIVFAIFLSQLKFEPPKYIISTLGYVGGMSMPLALICTGASIRWRDFKTSNNLYWASIAKLIIVPGLITLGGILVGLRDEELGVLFLMSAAPAAAAGYPMLRAAGGNYHLGAAIIATTAIAAIVPITLGLFILRGLQLI